jgi:hypothetical protein
MQERENIRQLIHPKVVGPRSGVEPPIEPEVHRVGTVLDGRPQTVPVSGRRQELDRGRFVKVEGSGHGGFGQGGRRKAVA